MIGLVAVTAAGRSASDRVATALRLQGEQVTAYDGPAAGALRLAWGECDAIVAFLATGATVRLIAGLLDDKARDPGVVCVDEAGRHAVSLVGGHQGGANALALLVADVLGAAPVVTTASDAVALPGLDMLGWPVEGDVAGVARALLDGGPVHLLADATWPLPPLGLRAGQVGHHPAAASVLRVSDRRTADRAAGRAGGTAPPEPGARGRGQSRRGPPRGRRPGRRNVAGQRFEPRKRGRGRQPGPEVRRAGHRGAGRRVRRPLPDVHRHCPGRPPGANAQRGRPCRDRHPQRGRGRVLQAGAGGMVVSKRKNAMATVAVGRRQPVGRLAIVGIGPGARDLMAPRAVAELRRASVVVGLDQYVDQVRDLLRPGTRVLETGLGSEEERARTAVAQAQAGHAVALIGSGDARRVRDGQSDPRGPGAGLAAGGPHIDVVGGARRHRSPRRKRFAGCRPRQRPRLRLAVRPAHTLAGDRATASGGGRG